MIPYTLLFFGAVFLYAGFLSLDEDLSAGLSCAAVGAAMAVWPAMLLLKGLRQRLGLLQRTQGYREIRLRNHEEEPWRGKKGPTLH